MEYRVLGNSGYPVSKLAWGTMTFGAESDETVSHAQLDRFVEAGRTLVDTADVYSHGESEKIIGRWLAKRSPDVTDRVESNLAAGDLHLDQDEVAALNRASAPVVHDYPYCELGVARRERKLTGRR